MHNLKININTAKAISTDKPKRLLGRLLVEEGHIQQEQLLEALELQKKYDATLGEILIGMGAISPEVLLDALALQTNSRRIDLLRDQPRLGMASALPVQVCLQNDVVPWLWIGNILLVATNRPDEFKNVQKELEDQGVPILPVVADLAEIHNQINRLYGYQLAQKAITKVANSESCRTWGRANSRGFHGTLTLCAGIFLGAIFAPNFTFAAAVIWGIVSLTLIVLVKAAGFLAQIIRNTPIAQSPPLKRSNEEKLPLVSILVPLFHEHEIANALLKRLEKLTYPRALLDVVLVLEEKDKITPATLARSQLPHWIRVVTVPETNGPTTKPRAMNYALDFCRAQIIGVWDAEDAPQEDQVEKIVARFQEAPENVVCLQGVLDYYNPRDNWLARCFTIEYATWWRVVLPGIAKLGLVIPLGGTTLFFKRDKLEELGRWDAHNVTEDADLGVRLARHGYVTELIPTVTYEEANYRPWRWVRQRSRWLKGFLITYIVHMRHPIHLLRDLGISRFIGLQMVFLASFSQFAMAPVLWSFWAMLFGFSHPAVPLLGNDIITYMLLLFFTSEILTLTLGWVAVSGEEHRHLMKWVPTMPLYFTLGTLAAYKALFELLFRPFYWDKTEHGVTSNTNL